MRKSFISLLLVCAMLVGAVSTLASCNNGNEYLKETYNVPEEGYDGSAVTITFYHSMGANLKGVLDTYIAEFNKLYPNITIDHSSHGDYDGVRNDIKTALTAGNQPNIAYCYPDHVAFYNTAKAVVPLDNFIESQIPVTDALGNTTPLGLTAEQLADFVPGYYNEGAVFDKAGTMYTLPMSKSTEALYYNKTFFEENGLELPKTWDEMEALCARIKEIDPYCIPLGYDSESNWFITMCEQLGSGYTTQDEDNRFVFDNDKNKEFVTRFHDWYQKWYITTEAIYGAYTSGLFTTIGNDATGKPNTRCYMVIGSTGGASYQTPPKVDNVYVVYEKNEDGSDKLDADGNPIPEYELDDNGQIKLDKDGNKIVKTVTKNEPAFEAAMATPPQIDPSNPKVISQGPSLCIFKDSNPQEVVASWLFVKFLTTNVEFQALFSMTSGYAPVIKSVQENESYQNWLDLGNGYNNLTALSVKTAIAQNDAYYVSPAFNGSSEARDQVGQLLQDALVYKGEDFAAKLDQLFADAIDECEYAAD